MSGNRSGGQGGARGDVRIKRAGAPGWENYGVGHDRARIRGIVGIKAFGPAIVVAREAMRDIHDILVKPGDQVMVWKKQLDRMLAEGRVREMLQTPELLFALRMQNIVVNEGLDHLLDVTLSNATQTATWYVGLTDDSPTVAAADVMSSHAGWTEFTEYSEAVRQTWTDGGVSGQSVDNSGSVASFSCNNSTNGGLGGLFLVSNNTKGGTTGILYSGVAITGGNKVVSNGDTIEATYTFTMADDGA